MVIHNSIQVEVTQILSFDLEDEEFLIRKLKLLMFISDIKHISQSYYLMEDQKTFKRSSKITLKDGYELDVIDKYEDLKSMHIEWISKLLGN